MLLLTKKNKSIEALFCLFFLVGVFVAFPVKADFVGQRLNFSIDSGYDDQGRSETMATLPVLSDKAYFYVDENWWNSLDQSGKVEAKKSLEDLAAEFDGKIYPTLTASFGSEWRPGIDGEERVTLLFHPLREDAGGYFATGNEYPKIQNPQSNEREMVYLNTKKIGSQLMKSYLAHEFVHLITFYQKDKLRGVAEDVWLNEARAEYAPTLLGYDLAYDNSNLKERVRQFVNNTFNSLTEWQGVPYDYGVASVFIQYLADQYGPELLFQSFQSSKVGITSLEETMLKLGFREDFATVFSNWAIAVLVNDCSLGQRYCYSNPNLKNFRVVPLTNILPLTGESQLSSSQITKAWAGNWYRFLGGKGDMVFEFSASSGADFRVTYFIETKEKKSFLNFLSLDSQGQGKIEIPDFGTDNTALTIIPVAVGKKTNFSDKEPVLQFSWQVTIREANALDSEIKALLAKISLLEKEIQRLKDELAKLQINATSSCGAFSGDLYYGMSNSGEVRCLQEFLKSKGQVIYPEGLVTGNYYSITTLAVKRYQASKGIRQTGYFGPLTRQAANWDLTPTP
jgi:hypothetical protein